ncbi:DNA primase family protein [Glutamicibacter uratoxydans]|uniref:DNA primase family protein n=1 Tax=Glutamicibacter uratoxydans TaxID=43667 RepID=UPI003D6F4FE3
MSIPDYFAADTFDPEPIEWKDKGLRSHQRMAARFAQLYAGKCKHINGMGWHVYDGKRWAEDKHAKHAHRLLNELLTMSWNQEAMADKDLSADIRACMTANGSNGVLELASKWLTADADEMDANPYLLNVANGTLDLHTQELRPHDPADNLTKITRAGFNTEKISARWLQFLESSLPDPEVRHFLQRYIGSALIGRVREHVLVVATGTGRNGKSVLADAVSHALGDYGITASNDMLVTGRHGHKSASELSAQMDLRGARWAVMSELEKGAELAESTMKQLTGGDRITAKHMGQDRIQFDPSHSFFMLTNDLPKVDPTATAVWARIRIVPFEVSFEGREDKALPEDLLLAADGILSWAVAGLWEYQQDGLNAPAKVMAATTDYRAENDSVKQFIAEECVITPNARVSRSELHHAYLAWAKDNGAEPLTPRALSPRIAAISGVTEGKSNGNRIWKGAGLKNDESILD